MNMCRDRDGVKCEQRNELCGPRCGSSVAPAHIIRSSAGLPPGSGISTEKSMSISGKSVGGARAAVHHKHQLDVGGWGPALAHVMILTAGGVWRPA